MVSNEVYDTHLQQEVPCPKRTEPQDDRISRQNLQEMNFNRVPFAYANSVEAKWKVLYKHLFPDEEYVPSPCMHKPTIHLVLKLISVSRRGARF